MTPWPLSWTSRQQRESRGHAAPRIPSVHEFCGHVAVPAPAQPGEKLGGARTPRQLGRHVKHARRGSARLARDASDVHRMDLERSQAAPTGGQILLGCADSKNAAQCVAVYLPWEPLRPVLVRRREFCPSGSWKMKHAPRAEDGPDQQAEQRHPPGKKPRGAE